MAEYNLEKSVDVYSTQANHENQSNYSRDSPVTITFDQPGIYHSIRGGEKGWSCDCPEHKPINILDINDDFSIKVNKKDSINYSI